MALAAMAGAIAAIATGLDIGTSVSRVILKYDKNVYNNRISEIKGYREKFGGHLDTLSGYRTRLTQAWDDEVSKTYVKAIDKETKAVQNAIEQADNTVKALEEIMKGINDSIGMADKVDDIKGALDVLNIAD